MRQVGSVVMAATRQIIWKLLLLILVLAAAEVALFQWRLRPDVGFSFGELLESDARWGWLFRGAMVGLFVITLLVGTDRGGKLTYTLRRLRLGEPAITTIWAGVFIGAYLILWAAQLGLVLGAWAIYGKAHPSQHQSIQLFSQFYNTGFLHGLLPLADKDVTVTLALQILCLGWAGAYWSFAARRGRRPIAPYVVVAAAMIYFPMEYTNSEKQVMLILVYGALLVYFIYAVWWRSRYEEAL